MVTLYEGRDDIIDNYSFVLNDADMNILQLVKRMWKGDQLFLEVQLSCQLGRCISAENARQQLYLLVWLLNLDSIAAGFKPLGHTFKVRIIPEKSLIIRIICEVLLGRI